MKDRQCFPCTACCQGWLTADVDGAPLRPGSPCPHVGEQGCGNYVNRPVDPCIVFRCAWLRYPSVIPEHLKPSACGTIILLGRRWRNRNVIRAVPAGEKIPPDTLDWLMALSRKLSVPLMFCEHIFKDGKVVGKKKLGYGPPDFVHEVKYGIGPEDIIMSE